MKIKKYQQIKLIDLTLYIKKKIYNEFNILLYKDFNLTISETNYLFGYREGHLYDLLEKAYEVGGPSEIRKEIDYIRKLLTLIFNKIENNNLYDEFELMYHYTKKYYKSRKQRKVNNELQISFQFK